MRPRDQEGLKSTRVFIPYLKGVQIIFANSLAIEFKRVNGREAETCPNRVASTGAEGYGAF
jgi:hypothetical protein